MTRCLVGLGSNLGHRGATLRRATSEIARLLDCQLLARSRWHETVPIGGPDGQQAFLNAALLLETTVPPLQLAQALWAIEARLGRSRSVRWDARSIDIDLLLFGDRVVHCPPKLLVPHPRMSFRGFVLAPAVEIAGAMMHPLSGWTVGQLDRHLALASRYVAVCAPEVAASTWLAAELTLQLGSPLLEELAARAEGTGDSTPQMAVEFAWWMSRVLQPNFWGQDTQLSRRLASVGKRPTLGVPPVISSFWYESERVRSEKLPTGRYLPTAGGNAGKKSPMPHDQIVQPALVVAWQPECSGSLADKIPGHPTPPHTGQPDLGTTSFEKLLGRTGHGPIARIETDDPAIAVEEAVASIQSVWPELPKICPASKDVNF